PPLPCPSVPELEPVGDCVSVNPVVKGAYVYDVPVDRRHRLPEGILFKGGCPLGLPCFTNTPQPVSIAVDDKVRAGHRSCRGGLIQCREPCLDASVLLQGEKAVVSS